MLNILHNKINQVVPIVGIQSIDNSIEIEYTDPSGVTDQQASLIQQILLNWPLDLAKINKSSILDEKWNNEIKNGYLTNYGWKLGLTTADVTLLTGVFLLAKEAHLLGASEEASIIDTDGVSHTISITNFTSLMIQYGQYRTNLSSWYAEIKNQIEQALTIEQLENIII